MQKRLQKRGFWGLTNTSSGDTLGRRDLRDYRSDTARNFCKRSSLCSSCGEVRMQGYKPDSTEAASHCCIEEGMHRTLAKLSLQHESMQAWQVTLPCKSRSRDGSYTGSVEDPRCQKSRKRKLCIPGPPTQAVICHHWVLVGSRAAAVHCQGCAWGSGNALRAWSSPRRLPQQLQSSACRALAGQGVCSGSRVCCRPCCAAHCPPPVQYSAQLQCVGWSAPD